MIAERFQEIARATPDALALITPRRRITYAELDAWSDECAATIPAGEGAFPIVTSDAIALVPMMLGALKAGRFFVTIDPADGEARIEQITRASAVPSPHARELSHLLFTSGTTGVPKAVAVEQRAVVDRAAAAAQRTGRGAGSRVSYTALPGYARATSEVFGSLLSGATLVAFDARSQTFEELAATIEHERISTLTLTPALFRRFMRALPATTDLSSVRKLRIGADVMTLADVALWRERFPRTTTLERAYNSTEAGMVLHVSITHDMRIDGPLVPMGRPLPGVEARIEEGELVVRGPNVARGYWNAPELTAEKFTFDDDGTATFRTGDLVRRDDDGLFYFLGRRDARLKIRGRRIDPLEIENAIVAFSGAREAAVVAQQDEAGEARLVAYVAGADDVRTSLRGKVPDWMLPERVHAIDSLPVSPGGKVDRDALSRVAFARIADGDDLASIWSRILGCPVAPGDDFFALGGHSLAAAEIVSEVNRATGAALTLSQLVELNTVAKMEDYLRLRPAATHTIVTLRTDGVQPPLFAVTGKGGSALVFRELAERLDRPFHALTHHAFDESSMPRSLTALAACYVDAIRSLQPGGPYYLAGFSAGGFVAYEIARQLSRAGEQVAFAGLIDTCASNERAPRWKRWAKYAEVLRRKPRRNIPRFTRAVAKRILGRVPPPEVTAINAFYDTLALRESLQPYGGRVTLLLARYGWGTDCPLADAGWSALVTGPLEVIDIDAEHYTILAEDVDALAAAMRAALSRAGPRSAGVLAG